MAAIALGVGAAAIVPGTHTTVAALAAGGWPASTAPVGKHPGTPRYQPTTAMTLATAATALAAAAVVRRCARPRAAATTQPRLATAIKPVSAEAGLLLFEHINLNVLSTPVALAFYTALGCKRDARRPMHKTLHSNCGALTQFHTPSPENDVFIGESDAQRWRGEMELLYEDAASVFEATERVRALQREKDFAGSGLAIEDGPKAGEARVMGLHGNVFVLRVAEASRRMALGPGNESGARPGSEGCHCLGLGGASLLVPPGCAAPGARFYESVLGFRTEELGPGRWAVLGGPGGASQQLVFQEDPQATGEEEGEHVAMYIGDFEGCFERLREQGLIWVNPRFVHLDKSTVLEEALHYSCFRFKDIVDPDSGRKLFQLEHEVRSVGHKSCPLHPTTT